MQITVKSYELNSNCAVSVPSIYEDQALDEEEVAEFKINFEKKRKKKNVLCALYILREINEIIRPSEDHEMHLKLFPRNSSRSLGDISNRDV